jgi:hypothetical protein
LSPLARVARAERSADTAQLRLPDRRRDELLPDDELLPRAEDLPLVDPREREEPDFDELDFEREEPLPDELDFDEPDRDEPDFAVDFDEPDFDEPDRDEPDFEREPEPDFEVDRDELDFDAAAVRLRPRDCSAWVLKRRVRLDWLSSSSSSSSSASSSPSS